jgi:hypothetical protein
MRIAWLFLLALMATNQRAVAQDSNVLEMFTPVTGRIENGGAQSWTFAAASDAVVSFKVEAATEGLDPVLEIANNAGDVLIRNDDFEYPESRDAMVEAITIPRTGTYSVSVAGLDESSGEYTLTMQAGFAETGFSENFNENSNWRTENEALELDISNGNILLGLAGNQQRGIAVNRDMQPVADFYAEVHVAVVESQSGWIVGMTARQQDDNTYYLLEVNSSGQWRFSIHTSEGEQVLRDWVAHPAIAVARAEFTLGLMAQSGGFDFFYNGQLFGQAADATLENPGRVGLAAATTDSLSSSAVVQFDDLTLTVPLLVNQQPVIPQQLMLTAAQAMVRELEHRHLIPAGGVMALIVEESFAESSRPGVLPYMLGRGTTFTDFVLATTVTWQARGDGAVGCGVVFRAVDDLHYTLAYVDQTGALGLSRRVGDAFEPGIFWEGSPAEASKHLLVIAYGDVVYFYADGLLAGTMENRAIEGAIGNAVVNFDPVHTSCQFDNTWVWRWN